MAEAAERQLPSGHLAWPMLQQGERFPFFAKAMANPEIVVEPVRHWVAPYEEKYRFFIKALKTRKILPDF